jgi:PPK2 family polyphosphate:nucleotide phosphotransferase
VLQAMDTAGKDSSIRELTDGLNPQGCRVWNFKAPSTEERAHDFLWRLHHRAPKKGMIAIFNRSHYEDVLIAKVKGLAPAALIEKRYGHINDFERLLADHGTRIVKVMLHVSKDYQLGRLKRRLERPDKHWKFDPGDLTERARWDDYMRAYETAISRCSTEHAPWYIVPAERRWFRDLVLTQLLRETLEEMAPQYPAPTFDPADYPPESLV